MNTILTTSFISYSRKQDCHNSAFITVISNKQQRIRPSRDDDIKLEKCDYAVHHLSPHSPPHPTTTKYSYFIHCTPPPPPPPPPPFISSFLSSSFPVFDVVLRANAQDRFLSVIKAKINLGHFHLIAVVAADNRDTEKYASSKHIC